MKTETFLALNTSYQVLFLYIILLVVVGLIFSIRSDIKKFLDDEAIQAQLKGSPDRTQPQVPQIPELPQTLSPEITKQLELYDFNYELNLLFYSGLILGILAIFAILGTIASIAINISSITEPTSVTLNLSLSVGILLLIIAGIITGYISYKIQCTRISKGPWITSLSASCASIISAGIIILAQFNDRIQGFNLGLEKESLQEKTITRVQQTVSQQKK